MQERSCRWTAARLADHQAKSVARLRQFAVTRSPFYRAFHRGLEQRPLQQLPILTKDEMMERFDDLVTDRDVKLADAEAYLRTQDGTELFRDRYVVMSTSGSTGRRGVFLFGPREWTRALASITRPIGWVRSAVKPTGKGPPRSALIAASAPWHFSARVGRALATRIVPTLRLDAATPIEQMVARLNEWQPVSMATYPSVLRELAAAQIAGALNIRLQVIASSAEVLTAETREAVKRAWGEITLQDTYGATEYAPIATECMYGQKHLFEDGAVIEVVDDDGRHVAPGELGSRLLLTIFERFTQPLIRYEISDRVRLNGEPCSCGRPYRVIESIEGRQEDVLYFERASDVPAANIGHGARSSGRAEPAHAAASRGVDRAEMDSQQRDSGSAREHTVAVHPNLFHDALERFAVTAWQVVHDDAALTIRVLGAQDESLRNAIDREIRAMLAAAGAHAPRIDVRAVDQLERGATGKAPLIISRRLQSPRTSH